jgi:glutamine---fructose-6-phosphate transaminase (isomerizing)
LPQVRAKYPHLSLGDVIRKTLAEVEGAYAVCFIFAENPNVLIGARKGSPLILGLGKGAVGASNDSMDDTKSSDEEAEEPALHDIASECYLASDASAIIEYTNRVVYIEEDDIVVIEKQPAGEYFYSIEPIKLPLDEYGCPSPTKKRMPVHSLAMSLDAIEKGGYKHCEWCWVSSLDNTFLIGPVLVACVCAVMLKEIMSQPKLLEDCMRGRVNAETGTIRLGGLSTNGTIDKLKSASRIIIAACGTSFHSGLVGEYLLEGMARIPVEVEYASEFRYRNPILSPSDVVMVISQSGETADTLAALKLAKERGCHTVGLVNVVGSSIARETDAGVYLHVGPEIGVASTKAFTGQVLVFTMMALLLGYEKGLLPEAEYAANVRELAQLPTKIEKILSQCDDIRRLSAAFRFASNFLFLGRGFNFPVALEGALKLKEISYIHAEGYAAAEMKHGPIALIDKSMPVVVVAPRSDEHYGKLRANMEEVLARGGNVIAVTEEGNTELEKMAESVIYIPSSPVWMSPLLTVVPLQLMSYYIADMRKCSVDQPRNLAKSVTVE